MKKPLALLFLSFTIACSAWAEKYEYVRLKGSASPSSTESRLNGASLHIYDQFSLNSGDIAELIHSTGGSGGYVYFKENDILYESYGESWNNGNVKLVGPCTIYLARTSAIDMRGAMSTWRVLRTSQSGSTTLAWNGTEWEGSSDGSQEANNDSSGGIDPSSIKYDELLGWTWLTDTNWVYSYTNLSWYYMHSVGGDIYVWNANLPDNGWQKLERG